MRRLHFAEGLGLAVLATVFAIGTDVRLHPVEYRPKMTPVNTTYY